MSKLNKLLHYLLRPFMNYGAYVGANVDHEKGLGYTYYILEFPFGIKIFEKNIHGYYPCTDILERQFLYVGRKPNDELVEMYYE